MVIHEDSEAPVELPVIRKPVLLQPKKYVIVKNHVREVVDSEEQEKELEDPLCDTEDSTECSPKKKKRLKSSKKSVEEITDNQLEPQCHVKENPSSSFPITPKEIDSKDLDELRDIYFKCKAILNTIESKYGTLLNLNENTSQSAHQDLETRKRKRNHKSEPSDQEIENVQPCKCPWNKKTVFDESGNEISISPERFCHICPQNVSKPKLDNTASPEVVQIDYGSADDFNDLPDEIITLTTLLQDPNLEISLRNKIVLKIKSVKQDFANELRFNKFALSEQLKKNSEEMLEFKGTNLSSVPGYL